MRTFPLNVGAPIVTVQKTLSHRNIYTTLTYARLQDGTVAAGCYRAMAQIDTRMDSLGGRGSLLPGRLLPLADSLRPGTLNQAQGETRMRSGQPF